MTMLEDGAPVRADLPRLGGIVAFARGQVHDADIAATMLTHGETPHPHLQRRGLRPLRTGDHGDRTLTPALPAGSSSAGRRPSRSGQALQQKDAIVTAAMSGTRPWPCLSRNKAAAPAAISTNVINNARETSRVQVKAERRGAMGSIAQDRGSGGRPSGLLELPVIGHPCAAIGCRRAGSSATCDLIAFAKACTMELPCTPCRCLGPAGHRPIFRLRYAPPPRSRTGWAAAAC